MNKSEVSHRTADLMQNKLTRRSVLAGGIGGAVLLLEHGNLDLFAPSRDYQAYREFQRGYDFLTQAEQDQLLGRRWREYVGYDRGSFEDGDPTLCELHVTLDRPSLLGLEIQTQRDPAISLPVFEVQHNEDEERMLAPVLQTRLHDRQSVLMGVVPEGDHTFRFHKTVTSNDVAPSQFIVRPYIPHGSTFYESMLAATPVFGMRNDTFEIFTDDNAPDEIRRKALMNGLLFFQIGKLRKSDDGLLRYELWNGFTDEEGGHGKDPLKLIEKTKTKDQPGRVYDYDTGVVLTMDRDGEVVEVFRQYDTQKEKHIFEPSVAVFSEGVSPFDEEYSMYKEFRTVPSHGMTEFGMTYRGSADPETVKRITRYVSLEPEIVVDGEKPDFLQQEAERGRRIVAVRVNLERINDQLSSMNQSNAGFFRTSAMTGEIVHLTQTRIALEEELDRLESLAT